MIGKKIQKERKKLSITQSEMAKFIDCKQSHISFIENTVKDNIFIKYIKYLKKKDVDLNKLFE